MRAVVPHVRMKCGYQQIMSALSMAFVSIFDLNVYVFICLNVELLGVRHHVLLISQNEMCLG